MNSRHIVLAVFSTLLFFGCDDNPVDDDTPADPAKANQIATRGFQAIGDTLAALEDRDSEEFRNVRFDDIRDTLEEALTHDGRNGIAHLGLSIVEVLELNYSDEIWAVIDSLDAWRDEGGTLHWIPGFTLAPRDPHRMLIGRQFELMTTLPIATSLRMATGFPSNVSLAHVQGIITDTIIPALNRSVSHLDVVEHEAGTELRIHIDDNGVQEDIVIDLGEILVFSAGVHALRSGFASATAYDFDLFGPDGTYDWVDEVSDLDRGAVCGEYGAYVTVTDKGGGHVDLDFLGSRNRPDALIDSILVAVGHYNVEDRDEFLALRDGGDALSDAHADLVGVLNRLESAATFIRNRNDESEENVIKLADLTDLDAELDDPGRPNFMQGWNQVEDVIDFARDLITGPVTFTEELGPNDVSFTWTVDLSQWFLAPVGDWNQLLPYHQWNLPAGDWLTFTSESFSFDNGGYYYDWFAVITGPNQCSWMDWPAVDMVSFTWRYWDLDSSSLLQYLDGPNGSPIDLDAARFPYVPDYTFNGLFPGMDRSKWVQLIDILDPVDPAAHSAPLHERFVGVRH